MPVLYGGVFLVNWTGHPLSWARSPDGMVGLASLVALLGPLLTWRGYRRFVRDDGLDPGVGTPPGTRAARMLTWAFSLLMAAALIATIVQIIFSDEFAFGESRAEFVAATVLISLWCARTVLAQPYVRWMNLRAHNPDRARLSYSIARIAILTGATWLIVVGVVQALGLDGSVDTPFSKAIGMAIFACDASLAAMALLTSAQFWTLSRRIARIEREIEGRCGLAIKPCA